MDRIFLMRLSQIQPCQLYISSEQLSEVLKGLDLLKPDSIEPIPVRKIGENIIFTDGHTRALAAHLRGASEIRVYWEEEELDWDAYEICLNWCKDEKVHTIADLESRVVPSEKYKKLWVKRCEKMQQELEDKRRK